MEDNNKGSTYCNDSPIHIISPLDGEIGFEASLLVVEVKEASPFSPNYEEG